MMNHIRNDEGLILLLNVTNIVFNFGHFKSLWQICRRYKFFALFLIALTISVSEDSMGFDCGVFIFISWSADRTSSRRRRLCCRKFEYVARWRQNQGDVHWFLCFSIERYSYLGKDEHIKATHVLPFSLVHVSRVSFTDLLRLHSFHARLTKTVQASTTSTIRTCTQWITSKKIEK